MMNKKLAIVLASVVLLATPALMLADIQPGNAPTFQNLSVTQIVNIVGSVLGMQTYKYLNQ